LTVALAALIAAGCGGNDSSKDETAAVKGPVPPSLRTVESASEDIIDLALAGKRAEVVQKAERLSAAARGIDAVDERAAKVAALAASAPLLDVALASNHVFALVPGLFARYETPVPASVTELDYYDFEAKLESRAHDAPKLREAVGGLTSTWNSLRTDVPDKRAAAQYEAHVKAMARLTDNADPSATQREAQHGLDLVDKLEESFAG
jgi:hypothetical protein